MTAISTASATGWRASAVVLAAALLLAACTFPEVEDILHAGGKIAYDSMKARQQSH